MPMDPQPNIIALLLLLAPTPVWWRVSQWLSPVLHEYPIFKKNTFIEPWKSTITATLENCGSTLRDLVVLRDRSYRKFGGDTEVARGRGELAHWLSLPSPRGKKPPALHDSSSDPTAAPLKPERPIRPCLPDRFGFPKDAEELNKLHRGDVWKRPYIRSLASWTGRESVLGLSGFFDDTKPCPWFLLSSLNSLFHIRFANILVFYCWLLMHTVLFFFTLKRIFSRHLRESADYPQVGNKEAPLGCDQRDPMFAAHSANFKSQLRCFV